MRVFSNLLVTILLWLCSAASAVAQFPFLHTYLNTPNCYAHSRGIMMLDSIDDRCSKTIILSEKGRAMMDVLVGSLGLEPNSVALRTLPTVQFNRELWQGGFSRFVFGMGTDTIYDTNLDFLFQYADSINEHIAAADPMSMMLIAPSLATSGNIASTSLMAGEVTLLDEYLNRIIRCTVDLDGPALTHRTIQLPEALDALPSTTLQTSNLFHRGIRYVSICTSAPSDGSTRLFATMEKGVNALGQLEREHILLTLPANGPQKAATFKAQKGFQAAADEGALVNDTLYIRTYRSDAERPEVHFGAFVLADGVYKQIKEPKHSAPFPTWINDTLHGSFCHGSFAGSSFFFDSMPLMYHLPSRTYHDLGKALGISLDSVVTQLSEHKFGAYRCSAAIMDGRTATLLYSQNKLLHHATIHTVEGKLLKSGIVAKPNGHWLTTVLLDRDHLLFVSDDQVHAWVIPLE